jgi:phasin family protein
MNEQLEKFMTPVREINALAVENLEKLFDIQMKYVGDSAKIGIDQMKTASAITDMEGLKSYMSQQAEVSKQLTERAITDGRAVLELGNSYTTSVQKIFKDALNVS